MNAFGIFKCGKTVMDQTNDELYFGQSLCALLWILELESAPLCVSCIASDINYSACCSVILGCVPLLGLWVFQQYSVYLA